MRVPANGSCTLARMETQYIEADGARMFEVAWRRWRDEPYVPVKVALEAGHGGTDEIGGVECELGGFDPTFLAKAVGFALALTKDRSTQCIVIDALIDAYVQGRTIEMNGG